MTYTHTHTHIYIYIYIYTYTHIHISNKQLLYSIEDSALCSVGAYIGKNLKERVDTCTCIMIHFAVQLQLTAL